MLHFSGRAKAAIMLLAFPVLAYALVYLMPLGMMMGRSIDNSAVSSVFHELREVGENSNKDTLASALLVDLDKADRRKIAEAGRNLNQELSGFRSLLISTGKSANEIPHSMVKLVEFDSRWGEERFWKTLGESISPYTWRHFKKAFGLSSDESNELSYSEEDAIYIKIMLRTIIIATQVTALTLVVGYPLAYAVANGSPFFSRLVLTLVLLSFWASILARTTAWVVLLQTEGVVNNLLLSLHVISEPLQLIFNRFGAVVAMTHVLLPFAIMPIINTMKGIPRSQSDASLSLGAGRVETFAKVYFPQTLRGVFVGGGTVFILALGFYVTPALTGGPSDQMLSYYIAGFVRQTLNWGMASVLSVMLFGCVLVIMAIGGGLYFGIKRRKVEI